jgi:SAM-dependent methyltransferase
MRSAFNADRHRRSARIVLMCLTAVAGWGVQRDSTASSWPASRRMTLAEARPVITALGESAPPELRRLLADSEPAWGEWVAQRDAGIRGRIARGDEDSVVNLMLYGTTFTRRPRATPEAIAASRTHMPLADVMEGRLQDLLDAVEAPAGDERVAFARRVIERQGLAAGPRSRESARSYLLALRSRVLAENEQYARRAAAADAGSESERRAAHATLYRDRGLSTDSSLRVDFALDRALAAVQERRALGGRAERVAVVGPGLDFIDKAQGHDFYPVQMIQPFALADSLMRVGLATRPSISALDISGRVLDHLRDARQRARQGKAYRWNLVLERNSAELEIDPEFAGYWRRAGDRIGTAVAIEGAAPIDVVQARAIDVRAENVLAVEGVDSNIVFERIAAPDADGRFDLVVATNILVYYESFEQALAVSNMAGMLRAGGLLLTNQPIPLPMAWGLSPVFIMSVAFDRVGSHQRGDAIHVYRKTAVSRPESGPRAAGSGPRSESTQQELHARP